MVQVTWCVSHGVYPGHSREKSTSVGVRERVGADSRGRDGEVKASWVWRGWSDLGEM